MTQERKYSYRENLTADQLQNSLSEMTDTWNDQHFLFLSSNIALIFFFQERFYYPCLDLKFLMFSYIEK